MAEQPDTTPELWERDKRPVRRTKGEKFAVFYSNNTEVGMNPWDIKMKFAQLVGGEGNEIIVEDQCDVIMSVSHAKAVASLILSHVKSYEAEFGRVKLPFEVEAARAQKETQPAAEEAAPEK